MAKLNYVGEAGELISKEIDGLLETLQFVVQNKISGSKIKTGNDGKWEDADKLLEGFKEMFRPE
jgi:hypothetical protein